jgi:hypothetical protein
MWPFLLMEIVLCGWVLKHGCQQYTGVADFIDRANEWEIAGGAMLSAFFVHGLIQLLRKLFAPFRRWQRNRPRRTSQRMALEKPQVLTLEPPTRIGHIQLVQQQQPRKSDARDKKPQMQQSQGQPWPRMTRSCRVQFA